MSSSHNNELNLVNKVMYNWINLENGNSEHIIRNRKYRVITVSNIPFPFEMERVNSVSKYGYSIEKGKYLFSMNSSNCPSKIGRKYHLSKGSSIIQIIINLNSLRIDNQIVDDIIYDFYKSFGFNKRKLYRENGINKNLIYGKRKLFLKSTFQYGNILSFTLLLNNRNNLLKNHSKYNWLYSYHRYDNFALLLSDYIEKRLSSL